MSDTNKDNEFYRRGDYWRHHHSAEMQRGEDIFHMPASAAKARAALDLARTAGLAIHDSLHIVEVGCGHGGALFPLEQMCPAQITGLDISEIAVAAACEHAAQIHSRVQFHCGSVESVPASVDWVLLFDVIEHVRDPYGFLTDLHGRAVYYFIHLPIEHSVGHLLLNRPRRSYQMNTHLHFWSWSTLHIMLEDCGYNLLVYRFDAGRYATWKMSPTERLGAWTHRLMPRWSPWLVGGSVSLLVQEAQVSG